ncbi:hypothetical protein AGMMS49944_23960 [Spirochaetia bacterium]|nr:hypothetical protein AGMMS49944_23960 [Spirochaetia bacterium]
MRNKVYAILTGILCLGIVLACEFPQTISVKGSPELYLNLGNPFKDENILKGLLGDGFDGLIGTTGGGTFYKYMADPESNPPASPIDTTPHVQTFLISFPLIEPRLVPDIVPTIPMPPVITDLKLHEIPEFFGGDVDFADIPAYIFMSGFTPTSRLKLTWSVGLGGIEYTLLDDEIKYDPPNNKFFITNLADNIIHTTTLPIPGAPWTTPAVPTQPTLQLEDAFNQKDPVTLHIYITGSFVGGAYARADLVIKLPLKFTSSSTEPDAVLNGVHYSKLDMEGMSDDDIFGRGDGGDSTSDLFDQLDSVGIDINDVQNTLVRGMFLGVLKEGSLNNAVSLNQGNPVPITIPADDLKPPFTMGIFVQKGGSAEPFAIMPTVVGEDPKFVFKLAVSAKTKLNIPVIK